MIIRFTVVCVISTVLACVHETNAETRDKLKIHVPQHIRDIHHYHKETIHHLHHHKHQQYARGYGYGPPSKKSRYRGNSHNSVYYGGVNGGGRGGRYKNRGRRRNYGGKRYGMYNYAGKYRNWVNNGRPRKDLKGSATFQRPQNIRPYQDKRPPAPIQEEEEEPQHQDQDQDHDQDQDRDYNDFPQRDDAHLKQSPSQVGEKIHANINEILGLISKYSGRNEHYHQVRQYDQNEGEYKRASDQRQSQSHFTKTSTRPYHAINQQQNFQKPSQLPGFGQQNLNNYHLQTQTPQRNQHNNALTQAFQSFSYRGRQPEYTQTAPQRHVPPPIILGAIGGRFGINQFQSGRIDGDHDIGFGEGLEVVQDGSGI